MFPQSINHGAALGKQTNNHTHFVATMYQIISSFGTAYLKAKKSVTAINIFSRRDTVPFDRNIFNEVDFLT
jgi:hypothetical protein